MIEILSGEVIEVLPPQAVELEEQINNAWSELASSFYDPTIIQSAFDEMVNDPVCFALECCVMTFLAFCIFFQIVKAFMERG